MNELFRASLNFILDLVDNNLDNMSDAKALWDVVIYARPVEPYEMFKVSVEEQTGKEWNCSSMQKLIVTTGN
jgi:hypothetical protein